MAHYKFHNDCQLSVLTYEQVKRLDFVMDQTVPIHGRGNYPTLYIKLKELIRLVRYKLQKEHSIEIGDVRLNGGAASYVLAPENSHYNDLDLIFGTDLSNEDQFDVIRDVVLECLMEFYPKQHQQQPQQLPQEGETADKSKLDPPTPTAPLVVVGSKTTPTIRSRTISCDSDNFNIQINESDESDEENGEQDGDAGEKRACDGQIKLRETNGEQQEEAVKLKTKQLSDESDNVVELQGKLEEEEDIKQHSQRTNEASLIEEEKETKKEMIESQQEERHQCDDGDDDKYIEKPSTASDVAKNSHNQYTQHQTSYQMPLNNCAIKEAYVHKMVKVNDDDRWSLISLGVQQSEASNCCCGHINCLQAPISSPLGLAHHPEQQQQLNHYQQFSVSMSNDENKENEESTPINDQLGAQTVLSANPPNTHCLLLAQQQQQQIHHQAPSYHHVAQQNMNCQPVHQCYHHHHHQQQQQKKQSPNNIELKFVDRMRRKFEFSVDSFQIILDSLIQFYDYAPQSTITSHKSLISNHPSSTMINTRPLVNKRRCCSGRRCSSSSTIIRDSPLTTSTTTTGNNNVKTEDNTNNDINSNLTKTLSGQRGTIKQQSRTHHSMSNFNDPKLQLQHQQQCATNTTLMNGQQSRSFYQLPSISSTTINCLPQSISSEASSSGCSSSSSVVSSSSLSSDEDHDQDLYCDVESPSSASSTSSLSSTTLSHMLSSPEGTTLTCAQMKAKYHHQVLSANKTHRNQINNNTHNGRIENCSSREFSGKNKLTTIGGCGPNMLEKECTYYQHNSDLTRSPATWTMDVGCVEYLGWQYPNNYNQNQHHHHHHHQHQHQAENNCSGGDSSLSSYGEFETNNRTSCAVISENFYPTVIGRSEYGNFKEALYHLEKKLIATKSPEEIRGGGLLKYCNLLVKNYKPVNVYQIRTFERYMCSRFFIDFSDLNQQQAKLESYLANHFSDDLALKFDYLTILHNVVQRSTVCLMNHELRLTLNMIRELAFKLNKQQEQHQQQLHNQQLASQQQQQQFHQHHHHQQHQQQLQQVQQQQSSVDQVAAAQHHRQQQQQQQQHHYYQQQKPVLIQSGVYRVKLVNYTLATKPIGSS